MELPTKNPQENSNEPTVAEYMSWQVEPETFAEMTADEMGAIYENLRKGYDLTMQLIDQWCVEWGDPKAIEQVKLLFKTNHIEAAKNLLVKELVATNDLKEEVTKQEFLDFIQSKRAKIATTMRKATSLIERIDDRLRKREGREHPGFSTSSHDTDTIGSDIWKIDFFAMECINEVLDWLDPIDLSQY